MLLLLLGWLDSNFEIGETFFRSLNSPSPIIQPVKHMPRFFVLVYSPSNHKSLDLCLFLGEWKACLWILPFHLKSFLKKKNLVEIRTKRKK